VNRIDAAVRCWHHRQRLALATASEHAALRGARVERRDMTANTVTTVHGDVDEVD
jgi:hypothetical protein